MLMEGHECSTKLLGCSAGKVSKKLNMAHYVWSLVEGTMKKQELLEESAMWGEVGRCRYDKNDLKQTTERSKEKDKDSTSLPWC